MAETIAVFQPTKKMMAKTGLIVLFSLQALFMHAQADRTHIRQGNGKFDEGQFQQAEIEYRKALEKNPESYRADYNLGNALYRQKQYEAAGSKYNTLIKNEKDHQNLNRYYYNLGNTMFESRKYGESIEAYKNALKNNPADMDAKHNLQLAMRMLQDQQNQQQQQQQQQQEKNKQQQQQQEKNKQEQEQQQQQQQQQADAKGQITPEDAERILQALENEEKDVLKKVQEQKKRAQKAPLEKNW
jgi:tetratricopeptide (TPR) repeat protein